MPAICKNRDAQKIRPLCGCLSGEVILTCLTLCIERQGLCKLGAHVVAIDASEHNIHVAEVPLSWNRCAVCCGTRVPFCRDKTVSNIARIRACRMKITGSILSRVHAPLSQIHLARHFFLFQEHARSTGLVESGGLAANGDGRLVYRHMTAEDLHKEGTANARAHASCGSVTLLIVVFNAVFVREMWTRNESAARLWFDLGKAICRMWCYLEAR